MDTDSNNADEPSSTVGVDRVETPDEKPREASLFAGLGKHTLVYATGIIVARAVSFLLLPVYTRYLSPADYGVMALIEMTLDFIQIVAGAKIAAGVFRFYHKVDDERERERVVSTSFILVTAMYALVGGVTFLGADLLSNVVFDSSRNTVLIRIATANMVMGALLIVPLSFARVEDRSTLFVGANLTKALLGAALNILFLVGLGMGVLGVFLSSLIANTLVGVGVTVWLVARVGVAWSPGAAKNLLRYGVPLMATSFATFITTFSDRFFLQASADESVVGLYNLAYQFGFILVVLAFSPLDQFWGPKRFRAAREPNKDDILSRGFLLVNVVVLSVALAISLFVFDLLRVMATPAFHPAAQVVPLILAAYVLQCWSGVQDIGILVSERTEYVTAANFLAAAVALIGYLILVPRYLAWGAAWTTVLAFAVRYAFTYIFAQRLWRVEYRWRPVLTLVGWALLIAGTGLALPEVSILPSILIRLAMSVVYVVGVWALPILDARDRAIAIEFLTGVQRMLKRVQRRVVG